ncbi:unnamed protein product [Polarella glacialis]|uniref:RING-type E3 ubiquitin transferase n=1 Tax=Polarella glacialis TaxID=89957 RepID=A0A813EUK4_POLGL|nr:unnamed protein product [Polarella glacialis]
MIDPVATVDGCVYERPYIERWFRERRQQGQRITSPITGLELPSATLMPLVALQRAIEAYLAHRPELKREHMAGRSFEEAAQILQTDLFEKQAVHASTQDKLKRPANKALLRALHEAESRILHLEGQGPAIQPFASAACSGGVGSQAAMASWTASGSCRGSNADEASDSTNSPSAMGCPTSDDGVSRSVVDTQKSGIAGHLGGALAIAALLALLIIFGAPLWLREMPLDKHRSEIIGVAKGVLPTASALAGKAVDDHAQIPQTPELDATHRIEEVEKIHNSTDNPAFAGQLEMLRHGNQDEKQRAAFMLRIFASEHAENQVAIAEAGAIAPLVQMLTDRRPTLREEAVRALWNLARNNKRINSENQAAIGRAGAIPPLIRLLGDEEPRVRVVAAALLNDLATDNVENQVAITESGAIEPLVRILKTDEAPALVMAASLLKSLATNNGDRKVSVALVAAVRPLVALLRADTLLAQEQATSTLGALAAHSREIQAAIANAGAISVLVERLHGDMMQGTAATALRNLAADHAENQVAIVQAGAIMPLVKLLEDGMPLVREEAAGALWNLAKGNVEHQIAIARAGAAIPLVALLKGDAQEQATLTMLTVPESA